MFDTMAIAKRIKQARIDQNMTQLQLADAMGVSYQAVSNWERGNSMPDISKLSDLCSTLHLSVDELLGIEETKAAAVTKAMEQEELTVEELKEVAPILPPEQVKEQVESKWSIPMPDLSFLKKIPEMIKSTVTKENMEQIKRAAEAAKETFEHENLAQLKAMGKVKVVISDEKEEAQAKTDTAGKKQKKRIDLSTVAELAPFLDEEYLNSLVLEADLSDLDGLDELAPFLRKETLHTLAARADVCDMDELVDIAPFLEEQTIEMLIQRCLEEDEGDLIEELAPFAKQTTLDGIVQTLMEQNADFEDLDWEISDIYPFLSKAVLLQLAKYLLNRGQTDPLDDMKDYL